MKAVRKNDGSVILTTGNDQTITLSPEEARAVREAQFERPAPTCNICGELYHGQHHGNVTYLPSKHHVELGHVVVPLKGTEVLCPDGGKYIADGGTAFVLRDTPNGKLWIPEKLREEHKAFKPKYPEPQVKNGRNRRNDTQAGALIQARLEAEQARDEAARLAEELKKRSQ